MTAKGTKNPHRGKGKAVAFLRANIAIDDGPCLIWPFNRLPGGYGMLGYMGKSHYAHRFMCALVHGDPPKGHEASHSCNNGHGGCVHPKHLSWKTKSGNMQDRAKHGRMPRQWWGTRGKLTWDDVAVIRANMGSHLVAGLAVKFGVTESNIRHIQQGRTWKPGSRRPHKFTPAELQHIRTSPLSRAKLAAQYGVSSSSIQRIKAGKTFQRPEDLAA